MDLLSLARLFKQKWWTSPPRPTESFASKTVIVTGANVGLGFEAACLYVELDAETVILAVRSAEKGERAREAIEQRTGRRGVARVMQLDMGHYDSIKAFADRVNKEIPRLDVALLNAGVVTNSYERSAEGWETTLQVNTISTALLAMLLLPKLKASKTAGSTPHLTIVGSGSHKAVDLTDEQKLHPLQSFNDKGGPFNSQTQYGRSKLLLMYVTRELAARSLDSKGEPEVIVNDVCPGGCKSDLARNVAHGFLAYVFVVFQALFMKDTNLGSYILVQASVLGKEGHGKWWQNNQIMIPSRWVFSDEGKKVQNIAWKEIIGALEPTAPQVAEYA